MTTLIVRNPLSREGLCRILGGGGYAVTGDGGDTVALHNRVSMAEELVIIDRGTFDDAGFGHILEIAPGIQMPPIVVLADGFDLDLMFRVFAAGGRGCLSSQEPHQSFLIKLALVLLGERVVPAAFLDTFAGRPIPVSRQKAGEWDASVLSIRGQAVLAGLVHGMSNKTIAEALCLSEMTVKLTVRTVLRKLQVGNRTQAALKAQGIELIDLAWKRSCGLKSSGPQVV
ncbi:two-component system nitrate/nitrite response regulator NarL [Sphingomonas zeicaulis]